MRMMKKVLSISMIMMLCLVAFPITAFAGVVNNDVSATAAGNKITVSGTVPVPQTPDVFAVAVMVYDSNNVLEYMETASVSAGAYNVTLNHSFSNDTYTVKVADYEGGAFQETTVKVSSTTPAPTEGDGDGAETTGGGGSSDNNSSSSASTTATTPAVTPVTVTPVPTVEVTPENPVVIPAEPVKDDVPKTGDESPRTGDVNPVLPLAAVMVLFGAGAVLLSRKKEI